MNVMHVITGLGRGGAESMLMRLMEGLDRHSVSQSVVSLTSRGVHGEQIESLGIHLDTLGMNSVAAIPASLLRLRKIIRERKPDVIQTWLYHADLLGLLAARWAGGVPVAWNIRCGFPAPGETSWLTRQMAHLLSRLSAIPAVIIFNSQAGLLSHQAAGYRRNNLKVIPNGFELDIWKPVPDVRMKMRSELGIEESEFLVGMVGRYHPVKNHRLFLKAAARVRSQIERIRFLLVGEGISRDNIKLVNAIDEFGLSDCVILRESSGDLPRLLQALDCHALTSTSEGFPNVVGESMACGVPCVATDVGDCADIIGDTGMVVPSNDDVALSRGIVKLLKSTPDERTALASAARTRIEKHFGMDSVVLQYLSLYKLVNETVNERNPRRA